MEVEQSPEKQEPTRTKVQGTKYTVENQDESAQKDSETRVEKLVEISDKSIELVFEKLDEPNPEKSTRSVEEEPVVN